MPSLLKLRRCLPLSTASLPAALARLSGRVTLVEARSRDRSRAQRIARSCHACASYRGRDRQALLSSAGGVLLVSIEGKCDVGGLSVGSIQRCSRRHARGECGQRISGVKRPSERDHGQTPPAARRATPGAALAHNTPRNAIGPSGIGMKTGARPRHARLFADDWVRYVCASDGNGALAAACGEQDFRVHGTGGAGATRQWSKGVTDQPGGKRERELRDGFEAWKRCRQRVAGPTRTTGSRASKVARRWRPISEPKRARMRRNTYIAKGPHSIPQDRARRVITTVAGLKSRDASCRWGVRVPPHKTNGWWGMAGTVLHPRYRQ